MPCGPLAAFLRQAAGDRLSAGHLVHELAEDEAGPGADEDNDGEEGEDEGDETPALADAPAVRDDDPSPAIPDAPQPAARAPQRRKRTVAAPPPTAHSEESMAPRTTAPSHPLAGLLPSGVHLHVWRSRPGLSNVFLGRFPAEQVNPYGAIETFLGESVAPGIVPAPGQSEISFRVQVRDGANNVHADEPYSVQAQRAPGLAPAASVQSPASAPDTAQAVLAALRTDDARQRESEARLAAAIATATERGASGNDGMVNFLMQERLESQRREREMRADLQALAAAVRAPPEPPQPVFQQPAPQFPVPISDPVTQQLAQAAVDQMRAASKPQAHQPAQKDPFEHTLGILERAGELFHPKDDGGTATALVKMMDARLTQLDRKIDAAAAAASAPPPGNAAILAIRQAQEVAEALGLKPRDVILGPPAAGARNGWDVLGEVLREAFGAMPKLLQEYREIQMVSLGLAPAPRGAPAPAAPAQALTPEQQAAQVRAEEQAKLRAEAMLRSKLSPALQEAIKALLVAPDDEAVGLATNTLMEAFANEPKTSPIHGAGEQLAALLAPDKQAQLVIKLRQALVMNGYGRYSPVERLTEIVTAIHRLLAAERAQKAAAAAAEDAERRVAAAEAAEAARPVAPPAPQSSSAPSEMQAAAAQIGAEVAMSPSATVIPMESPSAQAAEVIHFPAPSGIVVETDPFEHVEA